MCPHECSNLGGAAFQALIHNNDITHYASKCNGRVWCLTCESSSPLQALKVQSQPSCSSFFFFLLLSGAASDLHLERAQKKRTKSHYMRTTPDDVCAPMTPVHATISCSFSSAGNLFTQEVLLHVWLCVLLIVQTPLLCALGSAHTCRRMYFPRITPNALHTSGAPLNLVSDSLTSVLHAAEVRMEHASCGVQQHH